MYDIVKKKLYLILAGSVGIALIGSIGSSFLSNNFEVLHSTANETVEKKISYDKTVFTIEYLNMRLGPSTNYDSIGVIEPGTIVNVIDSEGVWMKVSFPSDIENRNQYSTAWISSRYTEEYTETTYLRWQDSQN